MTTFVLSRDDIRSDLHPRMWEDLCDALGQEPADPRDGYPDEITIRAVQPDPTFGAETAP